MKVYISARRHSEPRHHKKKRVAIVLPWESDAIHNFNSPPHSFSGLCPLAPPIMRLPVPVFQRAKELAVPGVEVRFRTEPVCSGDIQLANNQFLNWKGAGSCWVIFVDERYGALWSHQASLYVFSKASRAGRRVRCEAPPNNLCDEFADEWQLFSPVVLRHQP